MAEVRQRVSLCCRLAVAGAAGRAVVARCGREAVSQIFDDINQMKGDGTAVAPVSLASLRIYDWLMDPQ